MERLNRLLGRYCEVFGYSSCYGHSWMESAFMGAVALLLFLVVANVIRRVVTGISDR